MRSIPILLVLLLVACSAPAPPPTPVPTAPPTVLPTRTPTPLPTALPTEVPPSPTPEPLSLTIWVAEEEAGFSAVEQALQSAAAATGVRLQVLNRPADSLRLSLATATVLGEAAPDLIWGDGNLLVGLLADDVLQPLPADVVTAMLPALTTTVQRDDALWGAPILARNGLLLLYNPALASGPPATSDELIVRSRAAATREVAGLVMAWDEARWLAPWLYAFGGALTDVAGTYPTLDTPAMIDSLNLWRELYRSAPTNGDSYRRAQRLLAQGYAAYAIDGDWSQSQYRTLSDTLTLEYAPLPLVPATGRRATPILGGDLLMLQRTVDGPQREAALALIAHLQEPPQQEALATALGRLPAREASLAEMQLANDPFLATQLPIARAAPGLPPTKAAGCALRGIDVWLPSVVSGRFEIAEIAVRMQREAEACLNR